MLNIKSYTIFYYILITKLSDIIYLILASQAQKTGKNIYNIEISLNVETSMCY